MAGVIQEDVGGLQIHIQVPGPAAQGKSAAKIQSHVHRLQMGHGGAAQGLFQRPAVFSHQVHMVSQAVLLHGGDLPALIGLEPFQGGHVLQELRLGPGLLGLLAEIIQRGGGVFVGPCYEQGIQLGLGRGNGQNFDNIFLIGTLFHGGAAAGPGTVAHGSAQGKAVQKRRNQIGIRHKNRLLNPHIIR